MVIALFGAVTAVLMSVGTVIVIIQWACSGFK